MPKCSKCGGEVKGQGSVSCWCLKDWCNGHRCGADDIDYKEYVCLSCGHEELTPEAKAYYERYDD